MVNDLPRPTIFAHRGSSAHAPENTLASFELALRQGADGIELDAKLSRDGQVVVIHDQTVDRTTDGSGKVNQLNLNELRKLDAGSHFDVVYAGEAIPTLEEVLKAVGKLTFINIELTNYSSPNDPLPEKVAALVKRLKVSRHVLFSSFNPIALKRINRLLPECPIGLLALPGWKGFLSRSRIARMFVPYLSLHPEYHSVSKQMLNNIHHHNGRVYTYTVNQGENMAELFRLGVDGIFTDDPPLAIQVRSSIIKYIPDNEPRSENYDRS